MKIPMFQVDAFASRRFEGNPAAICLLETWLSPAVLQSIAAENNLSETAFLVHKEQHSYGIRWFTPREEVDLCGHATLASAHLLFETGEANGNRIEFHSRSGILPVTKENDRFVLDFPVQTYIQCTPSSSLIEGLGVTPGLTLSSIDHVAVFEDQEQVLRIQPRLDCLERLDGRGVIVTAPGTDCDFVSRFFAPKHGIVEDPVTGSAHCILAPYWSMRLHKTTLHAKQLSSRGGEIECIVKGDRVHLKGQAITYFRGEIEL